MLRMALSQTRSHCIEKKTKDQVKALSILESLPAHWVKEFHHTDEKSEAKVARIW